MSLGYVGIHSMLLHISIFKTTATYSHMWTNHWSTSLCRARSSGLSAFLVHFVPIVISLAVVLVQSRRSGIRQVIQSVPLLRFLLSTQLADPFLLRIQELIPLDIIIVIGGHVRLASSPAMYAASVNSTIPVTYSTSTYKASAVFVFIVTSTSTPIRQDDTANQFRLRD